VRHFFSIFVRLFNLFIYIFTLIHALFLSKLSPKVGVVSRQPVCLANETLTVSPHLSLIVREARKRKM